MEDYHKPDQQTVQALKNIATRLRINSIKATTAAGSGHPTSCCSVAEVMSVLFFHTMKYRPEDPRNPNNDRFILSKGHAAPVLYAVWAETGYLKENELLNLRKVDSILEGHPVPKQQFVDVATGSLGQGLGAACGMAYTGKYFDKASYRVFCLLGDGEMSEGSVWEAMAFASYYQLDNLVAILDINRLGQSDPAPLQHHVEKYQRRCEAFGWHAIIVDGHSVEELCKVLSQPRHQPLAIIAKTIKGKGIPAAEDKMGWHGKPLPKDMADSVIKELQSRIVSCNKRIYPAPPIEDASPVSLRNIRMPSAPSYKPGDKIATRKAYGMALAKLGRYNEHVVALDGDTKNSTFSELFKNEHPNRYVECYIAEQNMVSVAIGCAVRDRNCGVRQHFRRILSPGPTTSSAWPPSLRATSTSAAPTVVSLLVRMDLLRWVWRIWLCLEPFPQQLFSILAMVSPLRKLWSWLPTQRVCVSSERAAQRTTSSTTAMRTSMSVRRRLCTKPMTTM
ncbi:Transketolase [Larimichthys crocea]|uniref:Transketolase n=1 Tax=Larimichthys crocea TaxID=215358 RepID=A0A6G0INZ7_LARCR|nr:Transketolase [Larimichthys crocea]